MGESLLEMKMKGRLFVPSERAERLGEVMAQVARGGGRGDRFERVEMLRFHGDGALATAGIAPVVMGDAEQPGGKTGAAFEAREPAPGLHKGFLGEVVREARVAPGEVTQEMAHGALVAPHQFPERGLVLPDQRAGNQVGIAHTRG